MKNYETGEHGIAEPICRPYNGEMYTAVNPPVADSGELANAGERVILHHKGCGKWREAKIIIAPKGLLYSGWVIGLNPTKQYVEKRSIGCDAFDSSKDWAKDASR